MSDLKPIFTCQKLNQEKAAYWSGCFPAAGCRGCCLWVKQLLERCDAWQSGFEVNIATGVVRMFDPHHLSTVLLRLLLLRLWLCERSKPLLSPSTPCWSSFFSSVLCEMRIDRDKVGYADRIVGVIVSPFPCLSFLPCNKDQCGLDGHHSKHGC